MHPTIHPSASLPPRKKYYFPNLVNIRSVSSPSPPLPPPRPQKEKNGEVKSTIPSSQSHFVQSGLGPGQEYEIAINMVRNNTRGPQTTKTITTSECQATTSSWRLGPEGGSCDPVIRVSLYSLLSLLPTPPPPLWLRGVWSVWKIHLLCIKCVHGRRGALASPDV